MNKTNIGMKKLILYLIITLSFCSPSIWAQHLVINGKIAGNM